MGTMWGLRSRVYHLNEKRRRRKERALEAEVTSVTRLLHQYPVICSPKGCVVTLMFSSFLSVAEFFMLP